MLENSYWSVTPSSLATPLFMGSGVDGKPLASKDAVTKITCICLEKLILSDFLEYF